MKHPFVQRWLRENTLIEPSLLDGVGVEIVIDERISALGGGESAYIAALQSSSAELDRLIAGIAVPETWLFRYPRSFELLLELLERRLASGAPVLRMLSVGCATGQEAYCMAMTALHAGWPADRLRIDAIDRNNGFLAAAALGRYGESSVRNDIPGWAEQFLDRRSGVLEVRPSVRGAVCFTRVDATAPEALRNLGPCDVVFCRNVLIYLNPAGRDRLLDSICGELAPGGVLFVGHAEHVLRSTSALRPVPASHAFALERAEVGPTPIVRHPSALRPAVRSAGAQAQGMIASAAAAVPPSPPLQSAAVPAVTEDSLETARLLADAGRVRDAEVMVRSIIARRGPSAPAIELLAMIRMSVNDAPGAKRLFEQAVYLEPARAASLLQLAILSEAAGETARAAAYWDRARRASVNPGQEQRS